VCRAPLSIEYLTTLAMNLIGIDVYGGAPSYSKSYMTKKKRNKPKHRLSEVSQRKSVGVLFSGLRDRRHTRASQTLELERFEHLAAAFDELLTQLRFLGELPDLDSELAHLLKDAQRWVIDGVDQLLSQPMPDSTEEARKLLELEYLFRDFAATESNLSEWSRLEPWNRQSKYGFGKLRQREEQRQALDAGTVIAARDYWITHSVDSHPKPLQDVRPLSKEDPSWSLLSSLGDLLEHTRSAICASVECIQAQGVVIPSAFFELPLAALEASAGRIHRVLHDSIPEDAYEALRRPRPKKQSPRRYWRDEEL